MDLRKIENDKISVEVDYETGVIVQIIDKRRGIKHLFSRRPELEIKKAGMGMIILEPFHCLDPDVRIIGDKEALFKCSRDEISLTWRAYLEEEKIRFIVGLENKGKRSLEERVRIAIYSACGRGGFWGDPDAEGATYSCRYYVDHGYESDRDTFSSLMTPAKVRGFRFEKHSYTSRLFPEARWIAVIDKALETGLLIRCLSEECLIATEDQFFDVEVNIIFQRKTLEPGASRSVEIEILLLNDIERVDYASEDLIAAVISPSIALPGRRYEGELVIYPLRDVSCDVKGYIRYDKNMSSIGKRGYCIDQVKREFRRTDLYLDKDHISTERGFLWRTSFSSAEEILYRMDKELYEIPEIIFELCEGRHVIRKSFTIQPEALKVLDKAPEILRKHFFNRYIVENEYIEGFYKDSTALQDLYKYVSRPLDLKKILNIDVDDIKTSDRLKGFIKDYLNRRRVYEYLNKIIEKDFDKNLIYNLNHLDLVFLYLLNKDKSLIELFKKIYRKILDHWYKEDLVGYYTAIHGRAGASRFVNWVLSLDLFDKYIDKDLKIETAYMLHEIAHEIYKITNVWAGNWEFSEAAGLLALSLKVEGPHIDLFREKALTVLTTLEYTFLRDGGSVELAAGYHHYDLESIINGAEILYYSGDDRIYRYKLYNDTEPLIRKALIWLWNIATPYNTAPALEDTNEFYVPPDLYVLSYLRYKDPLLGYIGRRLWETRPYIENPLTLLALILEDIDFLEERFSEYKRSRITILDDSGRFVYRESEDPDSFYLILDYGPHGAWHGHPDKLSFEVYYRREPLIVDAGSGGYYNPIHWRWNRKTIAHNTISRDEEDHVETRGRLINYSEVENGFRAFFSSKIYEDVILYREISFNNNVDSKIIFIKDLVQGSGDFRWNIHVRGSCEKYEKKIKCSSDKNRLYIESFDNEWVLSQGYRGDKENIWYIYRVKKIVNKGEFLTRIVIY
jgi:hypothetical protein